MAGSLRRCLSLTGDRTSTATAISNTLAESSGSRASLSRVSTPRRMHTDAAHKTARAISRVCAKYPGCMLLFERLRKIKVREPSKSRRLNRKQANQLRGQINQRTREQAYAQATVTVEVNPHGTSQYCARCGAKGQRFSLRAGKRTSSRGGKLFCCPVCHYEVQADFNASVNIHHAFFGEYHWRPRPKRSG
jgi:transposase